jgi:phosphoribosyl-AMP cyclohydrolase
VTFSISEVVFDDSGLVSVIVQDITTNQVLMLGYATKDTLEETIELGKLVFFSRSRNGRWLKGETSGNFLELQELSLDCDKDSILAKVRPTGPTCHTGAHSCFGDL